MRNFIIILTSLLITSNVFCQNTFDKSLNEVSSDIAGKLTQKNKKKIVVLYITDINKSQTVAGKYIADVISVNIVNDQGNFEVFDRENLSGIAEAKKMITEGYIDADKAKALGRILAVEAIIIGNYTVLTSTLKLTLKALDVNNGFVIAATMKDLPINDDAGALLGINVGQRDFNANRGFNNLPLNSNENYNNPETVSKECETKNTGDYCFSNNTDHTVYATVFYNGGNLGEIVIDVGQTQCFYDIKANSYKYVVCRNHWNWYMSSAEKNGQIRVEKCKSKTFIIK